jgi:autotransporter-associated beta strand protein
MITPSRACALGLAAAFTVLTSPHASAQTNTWNGGGTNGNWTEGANWAGGVAPAGGSVLIFAGAVGTAATNDFTTNTVFNLRFDPAASPFTLSGNLVALGSANDASGNIRFTGTLTSSITQTIAANLDLSSGGAGGRTISVVPNGTIAISGNIAGTNGLTKAGGGTLVLSGVNSFSGPAFNISGGTVRLSSIGNSNASSAAGAVPLIRIGSLNTTATLILADSSSSQSSDKLVSVGDAQSAATSGGAIIRNDNTNAAHSLAFSGAAFNGAQPSITLSRTLTLGGVNTGSNTIAGVISNNNATNGGIIAVTKADAGTWILAGSNAYTGPTTVSNGTLRLSPTGLINSNSAVTVAASGSLGGAGTIGGTLTVNGNLFPGNWSTNAATLTVQGAVTNTGSSLVSFRAFGNATNDSLTAPAGANISGTVQVTFEPPYVGTSGDSFDFVVGPISGAPTNFILPTLATNLAWVTNDWTNTGILSITNVAGPTNAYAQWLTNYPSLTNTNVSADPELDGFDNGTEFAFDGDPTVGTPALVSAVRSGTNVVVSFVANTNAAAVTYDVQSTANLSAGPWTNNPALTAAITNSADQSGLLLPAFYERREFSVGISTNEFYRVRATILP